MRRPRLFEITDFGWLPGSLRDAATDDLRFKWQRSALYRPVAARLARVLEASGMDRVLDLASGGGGPVLAIYRELAKNGIRIQVTLTDRHPNLPAFAYLEKVSGGDISFIRDPVNAASVPPTLGDLRMLCAAAHHFPPEKLMAILRDAVEHGNPVAIFDISSPPSPPPPIMCLLASPPGVMLSVPFIRPFRWSRLFWTYILPLLPLLVLWDALMSALRAYSVKELEEIVRELPPNDYVWEIGKESFPNTITYLTGYPAPSATR
ncbi:MAG: class I SAM-dependent methyltransferase [Dehalococcoidia bacterium]|mgnify:CR=1 FL=1|jgi:hypothetical protein